jgi:hypothetical protein
VFTFANGNKQSGKWIEQARCPRPTLCTANAALLPCVASSNFGAQKEEGAEEDAVPKLVWITDAEASI